MLQQRYWAPLPEVRAKLFEKLHTIPKKCLEVGPGKTPFPLSTHFIDLDLVHPNTVAIDIDEEKLPFSDNFFDFVYSRHTLEDIQSPNHIFQEMVRISPRGFIETPSPMAEMTPYCDTDAPGLNYLGYIHHRYILWSELKTNTLFCIPKYPILDYAEITPFQDLKESIYWNNYYFWDPEHPPKMEMLKNGKNFDIRTEYQNLLNRAIDQSRLYTKSFFE